MPDSINLGLIKAIHVGTTPPINTAMLWYNTNIGVYLHYYWDVPLQEWVPLIDSGGVPGGGNFTFKGYIDLSTNPDYPVGSPGDYWIISYDGYAGGVGGKLGWETDILVCRTTNPGGIEAEVGQYWFILLGIKSRDKNKTVTLNLTGGIPFDYSHNLGRKPAITILDSKGLEVNMYVLHIDNWSVRIESEENFVGTLLYN